MTPPNFRSFLLDHFLSHLIRWHAKPVMLRDTLAEHHGTTATIAYCVAFELVRACGYKRLAPERVAIKALFHDAPERVTGDTPGSAKRLFKDARRSFARWEKRALPMIFEGAPEELAEHLRKSVLVANDYTRLEGQIVRYADDLSALAVVEDEVRRGNTHVINTVASLRERCETYPWRWLKKLRHVYPELP
ncbi:hypothetical protein LCGC14_2601330 [marine sediment metagenome]|uniref:HD/PDEase domain-containing protein n=1 Tax=marine sediment metagenome TaxID=412755 RepID=A0A0F9CJM6_9ZZZZ